MLEKLYEEELKQDLLKIKELTDCLKEYILLSDRVFNVGIEDTTEKLVNYVDEITNKYLQV